MTLRYILFVAVLLFGTNSYGQEFHRIYAVNESGDTLLHHMASTTNSLGQFISVFGRQIDGEYKSLVFTKQDTKGNFETKREYIFGEDDEVTNIKNVDMMIHQDVTDSIFLAATLIVDDSPMAIVAKLHASRLNGFTSKRITNLDSEFEPIWDDIDRKGHVTSFLDSTYIYTVSDTVVALNRLEKDHSIRWTQKYVLTDTLGEEYDAMGFVTDISSADSTIYSMGLLNTFDIYQLILDSLSIEQMAKSYRIEGDVSPLPTGLKTIREDDAILAGYYTKTDGTSESYLFMTDTIGEVTWAKKVIIENASTEIYHVVQNIDNDIIISGKYFQEPDSTKLFVAAVDLQGQVKWISSFGPRTVDTDLKNTSLDATPEGGVNIAANGYVETGGPGLTFIKLSPSGNTSCSDTLVPTQFADLNITTDTLFVKRTIGLVMGDSITYADTSYSKIIEPQLNVDPRTKEYCPNEVIDELLTASVNNVDLAKVTYEWSTGAITDTTRVDMDGDYTVTVTISENSCYMMCDTVQLNRTTVPIVQIQPDFSDYCELGEITLTADVSGGTSPFDFLWNTGETASQISTTQDGNYTVRVIDMCNDTASATNLITVPQNILTLEGIINQPCESMATLSIFPTSLLGGSNFTYEWNDENNSTSDSIMVTVSGVYTVEVTDACGDMESFEFDISIEEPADLPVDIRIGNCNEQGMIELDADGIGTDLEYKWSNGETTEEIFVNNENATYSVTVTDLCGNAGMSTVTINEFILGDPTILGDCTNFEGDTFFYEVIFDNSENFITSASIDSHQGIVRPSSNVEFNLPPGSYDSIVINEGCIFELDLKLESCQECLRYASVFFPDATANSQADSLDISFGPVYSCQEDGPIEDVIKEYEFRIFNRWGQEVFMTNDPLAKWDGKWNDELVPSEAYIYVAKYFIDLNQDGVNNSTTPKIDEGDITVVR